MWQHSSGEVEVSMIITYFLWDKKEFAEVMTKNQLYTTFFMYTVYRITLKSQHY